MDRSSWMTRGVLYHRRLLPVDRLAVSFKMKLVATCWTVLHLIEKVCFRLSPASSNQNPCHCELLSVCHHQSHVTLDSELSRFRCHAVGSVFCGYREGLDSRILRCLHCPCCQRDGRHWRSYPGEAQTFNQGIGQSMDVADACCLALNSSLRFESLYSFHYTWFAGNKSSNSHHWRQETIVSK